MLGVRLTADGRPLSAGGSRGHVDIFMDNMTAQMGPLGRRNAALFGGRLLRRIRTGIRRRAKNRTGALERSWKLTPVRQNGLTVVSSSPYALMREHGGIIQVRRKSWLTFKVGGRWVKVRRVRQKGWGYIAKALAEALPDAERTFSQDAVAIVRRAVQRVPRLRDPRSGRFVRE